MTRQPAWLLDFGRTVHSQAGEDGVIERILQTLPENDKWCVELGAWDGVYLSNTRNLIENAGMFRASSWPRRLVRKISQRLTRDGG